MTETDELINIFSTYLPQYLRARKRFLQARKMWGSYTLKTDQIALESFELDKGFNERFRQLNTAPDTIETVEKHRALDQEKDVAAVRINERYATTRRNYIETLFPLYKAVIEAYAPISSHIKSFVEVLDDVQVQYVRFKQGEPSWNDPLLDYALRLENEGRLEEKLSVWP